MINGRAWGAIVLGLCFASASTAQERWVAASEVIGVDLLNKSGEQLGSVEDLVVDSKGKLLYAIVGHGGLLGIGEDRIAIPWAVLNKRCLMNGEQRQIKLTLAGMNAKGIARAPVVKKRDCPELVDSNWCKRNAQFFSTQVPCESTDPKDYRRISRLIKAAVLDSDGKSIAEIEALLLDPEFAAIAYAVLDHESTLIDDKLAAAPIAAWTMREEQYRYQMQLCCGRKTLDAAPRVTNGKYNELADPEFRKRIEQAFAAKD